MIRRSIAGCVLAALCWLSVPLTLTAMPTGATRVVQRKASSTDDHSCCPQIHGRVAPVVLLAINFPAMPCGAEHPCCIRHVPSAPSSVPVESKVVRPTAGQVLTFSPRRPSRPVRVVEISSADFLPTPFERSTVLRN